MQRGTYHPLAPAGVASVLVEKSKDLGYVDLLLRRALRDDDHEIVIRVVRDCIWLGIHYPGPTFATLRQLPRELPATAQDALATTLAIVAPRHPRVVAQYVKKRGSVLPRRVTLRRDLEWTGRYGNERGFGEMLGKRLLDSAGARRSLAASFGWLLDGMAAADVLRELRPRGS